MPQAPRAKPPAERPTAAVPLFRREGDPEMAQPVDSCLLRCPARARIVTGGHGAAHNVS